MSLSKYLAKAHTILSIACAVLEVTESKPAIDSKTKQPKLDENDQPVFKDEKRTLGVEEIHDFKVERETGIVKALTTSGQRVGGVLPSDELKKALAEDEKLNAE